MGGISANVSNPASVNVADQLSLLEYYHLMQFQARIYQVYNPHYLISARSWKRFIRQNQFWLIPQIFSVSFLIDIGNPKNQKTNNEKSWKWHDHPTPWV